MFVCVHICKSVCVFACISVIPTGRQVDKRKDVVLNEAGETQEDGVEEETHETQAPVQRPIVEANSHDLNRQTGREMERQADRLTGRLR